MSDRRLAKSKNQPYLQSNSSSGSEDADKSNEERKVNERGRKKPEIIVIDSVENSVANSELSADEQVDAIMREEQPIQLNIANPQVQFPRPIRSVEEQQLLQQVTNQPINDVPGQNMNPPRNTPDELSPQLSADNDESDDQNGVLTNLKALQTLLVSFFKGNALSIDDFNLSVPELHIFSEILIRKNRQACNER